MISIPGLNCLEKVAKTSQNKKIDARTQPCKNSGHLG